MICFNVSVFVFILFGTLCVSCIWMSISIFRFRKFSAIILSINFQPFSLCILGTPPPNNANISRLVAPGVPLTILIFNICLSFCCSLWVISIILASRSLTHFSVLPSLVFISSSVIFISVIVFFSSDLLFFFTLYSSLLKFSLCSSIYFPKLTFLLLLL